MFKKLLLLNIIVSTFLFSFGTFLRPLPTAHAEDTDFTLQNESTNKANIS